MATCSDPCTSTKTLVELASWRQLNLVTTCVLWHSHHEIPELIHLIYLMRATSKLNACQFFSTHHLCSPAIRNFPRLHHFCCWRCTPSRRIAIEQAAAQSDSTVALLEHIESTICNASSHLRQWSSSSVTHITSYKVGTLRRLQKWNNGGPVQKLTVST